MVRGPARGDRGRCSAGSGRRSRARSAASATPEAAAAAHREAGLVEVEARRAPRAPRRARRRRLLGGAVGGERPLPARRRSLSDEERRAFLAELEARLEPFREGDHLSLPRTLVLATGRRAAGQPELVADATWSRPCLALILPAESKPVVSGRCVRTTGVALLPMSTPTSTSSPAGVLARSACRAARVPGAARRPPARRRRRVHRHGRRDDRRAIVVAAAAVALAWRRSRSRSPSRGGRFSSGTPPRCSSAPRSWSAW